MEAERFMFSDSDYTRHSSSDGQESGLRFGMMLAEVWHEWFAAMSEVAYHTHRACEFLAENGGHLDQQFGAFDFRHSRDRSEGVNASIDMDKLKECLQSLEPMEAARVLHAVQVMQTMEAMLKRRRARGAEAEEAAW
jgi:replicative superfamily II helicase